VIAGNAGSSIYVPRMSHHIFTGHSDRMRAKKAWKVSTLASDHLAVVADLEIR
jgi:endonuclease/exonuclease/phosphatase family metal-dependent hydrolase